MIYLNDAGVGQWVADQVGTIYCPNDMTCIGKIGADGPKAGIIYEKFNQTSVEVHLAIADGYSPGKEFLQFAFEYPFQQLGVERLTGFVDESNLPAIALNLNLGFEIEARLERACPNGAVLIMRMFRENCRFLRGSTNG